MVRTFSRLNGWMPPPHPLQVMAWIMVLYLTASTFGVLAPSFASDTIRLTIYVVTALMIFVNIVVNIIVTTIDPADDAVQKKIRSNPRPGFDRGKHRHVIDENYFCNICETIIEPSSKHCRQCNKCVLDFDHHCKWLNNCVGAKNYRWFLFYIVSTALTSLLILALSLAAFTLHFVDRDSLYQIDGGLTMFGSQTKDAFWLTLVALSMALAAVASLLLMHLLVFHLRIIMKGMTTYNFIMEQRKKEEEKQKRKANEAASAAAKAAANTLASGVKLFSQTAKNPMAENTLVSGNGTLGSHGHNGGIGSQRRLQRLKQLLRWRMERNQNPAQAPGSFALNALPQQKNGFLAQDGNGAPKWKHPQKEELIMVDTSSDGLKPEDIKGNQTQRRMSDSKGRSMTPLPPILPVPNRSLRSPAISSFIQTTTPQSLARRKKRAGATLVQSPVPYEIMEDKENRISVSHIAATLPPDSSNKSRNGGRVDSAALSAFSRHADVPRLPPLAPAASASQNGKPALPVAGANRPVLESILLRSALTGDDLAASLTASSTDRRDDDTLREIPLISLSRGRQESITLGAPSTIVSATVSRRTPSGSSSESGSILAPLQVDALSKALPSVDQTGGSAATSTYVTGGRYLTQAPHGQRTRPLPPVLSGRHRDSLTAMVNDYDSRLSQFSDSGSLSSGSKRVRFNASPQIKRK